METNRGLKGDGDMRNPCLPWGECPETRERLTRLQERLWQTEAKLWRTKARLRQIEAGGLERADRCETGVHIQREGLHNYSEVVGWELGGGNEAIRLKLSL